MLLQENNGVTRFDVKPKNCFQLKDDYFPITACPGVFHSPCTVAVFQRFIKKKKKVLRPSIQFIHLKLPLTMWDCCYSGYK